ncbi:MAG: hypothetical protein ACTJGD_05830 [Mesonia hippocampi]|uniref:hypothetical protein n=1 Tax=Mesonia hippocampi TaxID=1628250 RepID=UPI003F9B245E
MKITFLSLFIGILLFSCSSDDDTSNNTPEPETQDKSYFPTAINNSWTYQNTSQIEGHDNKSQNQEKIHIADSHNKENTTFYTFQSNLSFENQGLVTGALTTGELAEVNKELIYNGNFKVDLSPLGISEYIEIPITNLIIYKSDANKNTTLAEISGTHQQDVNWQMSAPIPLTLNYSITSKQNESPNKFEVNSTTYTDVISAALSIEIKLDASLLGLSIPIMKPQEAVISINYFAKDVGLIYSKTTTHYVVEDLSDFGVLNIPDFRLISSQDLIDYNLQ